MTRAPRKRRLAVAKAIMHRRNNNRKKCILVTDSEYVYLGIVQKPVHMGTE